MFLAGYWALTLAFSLATLTCCSKHDLSLPLCPPPPPPPPPYLALFSLEISVCVA